MSLAHLNERRMSLNGRNAYISLTATENAKTTLKRDDSSYLTAKPTFRSLSCSPQMTNKTYVPSELENQKDSESNYELPKSMLQTPTFSKSVASESNQENNASSVNENNKEKMKVQTGMDRYILVSKRKGNSRSPQSVPNPKIAKGSETQSENRYALLSTDEKDEENNIVARASKPPPIYLREHTSNTLVNKLSQLLGKDNFHVVSLRRGNVLETKVQTYTEELYRKLVVHLDKENRNYYTYQLKSSKGLVIVLKGIDSSVPPQEIKEELEKLGYETKSVINIINRNKIPQPMFKVELTFESSRIQKKGSTHPIYDIRYLCNRKIVVEEPLRRTGPPQCTNCQEFGHTKAYCKLPSICVRCSDVHRTADCPHPKTDSSIKKCSNCGENHTANYRGCRVYTNIKNATRVPKLQNKAQYQQATHSNIVGKENTSSTLNKQISNPPNIFAPNSSYAQILKNQNESSSKSSLENSIEKLIETMFSFMTNMQGMIQEMMRNQSILIQTILNQK